MIPLIKPVVPSMADVAAYLEKSFETGQWTNGGPLNQRLRERLRADMGLPDDYSIVLTSSGHTALMAAYFALSVRRVVVPAYTFESTRCAATIQGIEVIYADVGPNGCLTVDTLRRLNPASYDGVVAVCALSTIPDLEAISDFCRAHNKALVIDGAATYGTRVPVFGDAFCLSFHATKSLPMGEGGAVLIRQDLQPAAHAFCNFGRDETRTQIMDGARTINAKMSDITAAIGLSGLDRFAAERAARLVNAEAYRRALGWAMLPSSVPETVYAFLPLFARTPEAATKARAALKREGIGTLAYYLPLLPLPMAQDLYSRNVCVPVHSGVDAGVIAAITAIFEEADA